MKIYLFLAEGFEEIEAIAPIDIFRRAEMQVITVSVTGNKMVNGAHQIAVQADQLFDEVQFEGEFMIFLPGGLPGTTNLGKHAGLQSLILKHAELGGQMAAICAAPSILGNLGLLEGKEAICYPGFENTLKGATVSTEKMVQTGKFFTAKAAGVAIPFALQVVASLKGAEVANAIRKGIFLD
jgi:4-methyl-5(b-hydroxyethyl)-thiazole monophosphate biosynthesis